MGSCGGHHEFPETSWSPPRVPWEFVVGGRGVEGLGEALLGFGEEHLVVV